MTWNQRCNGWKRFLAWQILVVNRLNWHSSCLEVAASTTFKDWEDESKEHHPIFKVSPGPAFSGPLQPKPSTYISLLVSESFRLSVAPVPLTFSAHRVNFLVNWGLLNHVSLSSRQGVSHTSSFCKRKGGPQVRYEFEWWSVVLQPQLMAQITINGLYLTLMIHDSWW